MYCYSETQLHFLELVWSFQVHKNLLIGSREALRLSLNVSCCWAMTLLCTLCDSSVRSLQSAPSERKLFLSVLGCMPADAAFLMFPGNLLVGICQLILGGGLGLPSEGLWSYSCSWILSPVNSAHLALFRLGASFLTVIIHWTCSVFFALIYCWE